MTGKGEHRIPSKRRFHPVVNFLIVLAACGGGDADPGTVDAPPSVDARLAIDATSPTPDAPPAPVQASVGPAGGSVTMGGALSVDIPAGALDAERTITVAVSRTATPAGALTPLYELSPSVVFAKPVKVSFTLPAGASAGDVYWSRPGGAAGYDDIGGTIDGGRIVAEVVHFSSGYVGPAATTRTVTGSQVVSYVSASAVEHVPADLRSASIAALVEDGQGGYTTIPGTGHADGTFTIDNVPDGAYWLSAPTRRDATGYFRTSSGAIDAGYKLQGRRGLVALTQTTNLTLNLTGLAPWQDGDMLEMFSTEAHSWFFDLQTAGTPPAVGATSLAGFTVDRSTDPYRLEQHAIDGARTPPDRFFVAQLGGRTTTTGVAYQAMTRLYEAPPFSQSNGVAHTLTGAFADVSLGHSLDLDVRMAQFRAALDDEPRPCDQAPGYPNADFGFGIEATPGGLEHGIDGITADLLLLTLPKDNPDVVVPGLSYGTPLTGSWTTWGLVSMRRSCRHRAQTGTTAVFFFSGMTISELTFGTAPIVPVLSQVRSPSIAGLDLYASRSGVGTTPALAWTAPAIGTPTAYDLAVWRLTVDGTSTVRTLVALFRTDQTTFRFPPGVLVAGGAYVVTITATTGAGITETVNRDVLPRATSTVVSGILRP